MDPIKIGGMKGIVIFAVVLCLLPVGGNAATITVNCDAGEKIQAKLDSAKPGDTLLVTGTCNENVRIEVEVQRITLDGQGRATINGADVSAGRDTLYVNGRGIIIKGFTITGGGQDGLHISGATAFIDGNTIQRTRSRGIFLDRGTFATIFNNRIQDNPTHGIMVHENSIARIGFALPIDPKPSPNTIQKNGGNGIYVWRSSTAWIVSNTITGNKRNGIWINRNSEAQITGNRISGNGEDAISVSRNSGVIFGTGEAPLRREANNTDAQLNNGGFGVRCTIGGYVEGPQGTLNGAKGAKECDKGCIDSLTP